MVLQHVATMPEADWTTLFGSSSFEYPQCG